MPSTSPAVGEVPSGTIDGVNATFTLAHTPTDPTRVEVFKAGVRQTPGTNYTVSVRTITFLAGSIPTGGQALACDYPWDDGQPAAQDLTSLANVKLWLGITDSPADAILSSLITRESAAFLLAIDRTILSKAYTETIDGNDPRIRRGADLKGFLVGSYSGSGPGYWAKGWAIDLKNWPVIDIISVVVDGQAIPQGSNPGQSTQVDGWMLVDNYRLELLGGTYSFTPGVQNIVISYDAGYASVPSDVDQAVCELVGYRFRERGHIGERSKSGIAGESVSFMTDLVPPSVQAVINSYRRVNI